MLRKKRKFLREGGYKKEEDGEKQEGERNGVNLQRGQQRPAKRKKRNWYTGPIVKFFKHPQYVFFLSSTTSIRKGKRKLKSQGTETMKQERKLNHTDSERAEVVSKRWPTPIATTFSGGYAKNQTSAHRGQRSLRL